MGKIVPNTGPEPAVIDEELCRKCISTLKPKNQAGEVVEHKKDAVQFREVRRPHQVQGPKRGSHPKADAAPPS